MPKQDITSKLIVSMKALISEGALAPGCKFPPERELASRFGVSRPSLRQALKVLEIMGVISQRVGDGTYLSGNASQILNEPMEFLILLDGISIHELLEARSVIEPELAAQAAERATASDLRELARAIKHHESNRYDLTVCIEADLSFHEAIFHAAGNRAWARFLSFIHRSMWKALAVTSQLVEPQRPLASHKAIYAAIYKRNPEEARRQMVRHLAGTRQLLTKASSHPVDLRLTERIRPINSAASAKRILREPITLASPARSEQKARSRKNFTLSKSRTARQWLKTQRAQSDLSQP
ncbi:MAG: FadR/GntR family transcriptional regulator [Terriglobia bacterium]